MEAMKKEERRLSLIDPKLVPVEVLQDTYLLSPAMYKQAGTLRPSSGASWKSRVGSKQGSRAGSRAGSALSANRKQNVNAEIKIQEPEEEKASYLRVYKNEVNDAIGDQGDEELDNMAEDLIPSDKLETKKNKFKVLREIYDHTERKVLHN